MKFVFSKLSSNYLKIFAILLIFLTSSNIKINSKRISFSLHKIKQDENRCNLWDHHHMPLNDIREIVSQHNKIRQKIVSEQTAEDKLGSVFPPSSNMRELYWDEHLAIKAQILANRCKISRSLKSERNTDEEKVGENIFRERSVEFSPSQMHWKKAIKNWYKEGKQFKKTEILEKFTGNHKTRNFTQIIWANTEKIGCGYSAFRKGKWLHKFYVCLYAETGNVANQQVYLQGKSCSQCPEGTQCSKTFPGLCCSNAQCQEA